MRKDRSKELRAVQKHLTPIIHWLLSVKHNKWNKTEVSNLALAVTNELKILSRKYGIKLRKQDVMNINLAMEELLTIQDSEPIYKKKKTFKVWFKLADDTFNFLTKIRSHDNCNKQRLSDLSSKLKDTDLITKTIAVLLKHPKSIEKLALNIIEPMVSKSIVEILNATKEYPIVKFCKCNLMFLSLEQRPSAKACSSKCFDSAQRFFRLNVSTSFSSVEKILNLCQSQFHSQLCKRI